jgi:hypothetical protein
VFHGWNAKETKMQTKVQSNDPEDVFWRKLVLPEEDKSVPWDGIGFRWFRSENVIALEQYRRAKQQTSAAPSDTKKDTHE